MNLLLLPFLSRPLRLVLALLALLASSSVALADEIITLHPRAGVTQSTLIWTPHDANPETVLLLMPGGPGNIGLSLSDGQVRSARPHLFSRQREALSQARVVVAVPDAPSDQHDLTQAFRISAVHASDMRAVVRALHDRFPAARLVVVGHSRGTVSAGYLAKNAGAEISALVLLSGLYQAFEAGPQVPSAGPGLSEIDLPALKMPVLLIHHRLDACPVAPMPAGDRPFKHLPLIAIEGKAERTADSPCGPGTNHWFAGEEVAVGQQIINWLAAQGSPLKPGTP